MRLGAYDCKLSDNSFVQSIYKKKIISERHRHRYEVNNIFASDFKKNGMNFSGMSPDNTFGEGFDWENAPWFDANGLNDVAPMQAKTVVERLQDK